MLYGFITFSPHGRVYSGTGYRLFRCPGAVTLMGHDGRENRIPRDYLELNARGGLGLAGFPVVPRRRRRIIVLSAGCAVLIDA